MSEKISAGAPLIASVVAAFAMFAPTTSEAGIAGTEAQMSSATSETAVSPRLVISPSALDAIKSKADNVNTKMAFGEHWGQTARGARSMQRMRR